MKIKPNIAYHCATKELAEQFLKDAEEQNILWRTGEIPTNPPEKFVSIFINEVYFVLKTGKLLTFSLSKPTKIKTVEYHKDDYICIPRNHSLNYINTLFDNIVNFNIENVKQKVETAWVPFRNNNRISQFICETKEDCQNKINYWFGKDENVIPTKVEIKVAEDVKD